MSTGFTINRGYLAAVIIILALVGWMFSSPDTGENANKTNNPDPLPQEQDQPLVQVTTLDGELRPVNLKLSGRTEPGRSINLKAEIKAKVIAIHKNKGDKVKAGELILELDPRDWPARVKQAEANLHQRQLEHNSARTLIKKGLTNEAQLAQANTLLANAEAELTNARRQLDSTRIEAPFNGILNDRMVELGDYVQDGQSLVTLLDFNPWIISAQVPARDIAKVYVSQPGWATLENGQRVDGQVRFISSEANSATRSFRVELAISNPTHEAIPAGVSAELVLTISEQVTFRISPALLLLDDQGNTGIRIVDDNNRVVFLPVSLQDAAQDFIRVTGPAPGTRIISRGAGFVQEGQQVRVTRDEGDTHVRAD